MILSNILKVGAAIKYGGVNPSSDSAASLWGIGPTASGAVINEHTALNISAFYCGVNLISDAIKNMPLLTYRRLSPMGKQPATDHPIYTLLHRRPNPYITPSRFKKLLNMWAIVWGNGRAEIERDRRGRPIALWPIHPSRCTTYQRPDGEIFHQVYSDNGRVDSLEDQDMLHHFGLSKDGICGLSIIGMARESLGMTVSAEEYGSRFFGNNAQPSIALMHPAQLSELAKNNLKKSWIEQYAGPNIHAPAVLEEGMKMEKISMPNEDAQFLETRAFQITEIARWLNIPPHKLKDLSRSTFSNIEHQSLEFLSDTILPWATDLEEECDRKLFDDREQPEYFTEFLIDSVLRADTKSRNEAYEIMRRNGIINADEWRSKENMNPLPNGQGEDYLVPLNMTTASQFHHDGQRRDDQEEKIKDIEFRRKVVELFLTDGTTNDVVYNLTHIEQLLRSVGLPLEEKGVAPYLPVVAQEGPLVSGETIKDSDGDIVGGDVVTTEPDEPLADDLSRDAQNIKSQTQEPTIQKPILEKPNDYGLIRQAIVSAHRELLRDAVMRLRRVEINAVHRAMKKTNAGHALIQFYAQYHDTLMGALIPIVESFSQSIRPLVDGQAGDLATTEQCYSAMTRQCVDDYVDGVGKILETCGTVNPSTMDGLSWILHGLIDQIDEQFGKKCQVEN